MAGEEEGGAGPANERARFLLGCPLRCGVFRGKGECTVRWGYGSAGRQARAYVPINSAAALSSPLCPRSIPPPLGSRLPSRCRRARPESLRPFPTAPRGSSARHTGSDASGATQMRATACASPIFPASLFAPALAPVSSTAHNYRNHVLRWPPEKRCHRETGPRRCRRWQLRARGARGPRIASRPPQQISAGPTADQ